MNPASGVWEEEEKEYSPQQFWLTIDKESFESLRTANVKRLKEAQKVRRVHRSMAYKPINSVDKLLKERYLVNCPLDGRTLRAAEAILGRPCNRLKSAAAKKRTRKIKLYDRLVDGSIAIEVDVMKFFRGCLSSVLQNANAGHMHTEPVCAH